MKQIRDSAHIRRVVCAGVFSFSLAHAIGAPDILWNGTANDGDWGNPVNWEGANVPTETNGALLRLNGGTNCIYLGTDRTIEKIGLYNQAFALVGEGLHTLTLTGENAISNVNTSGGADILFNCDVILARDTLWSLPYGTVKFGGEVTGDASVTVAGGANRTLAIAGDFKTQGNVSASTASTIIGGSYTNADGSLGAGGTFHGDRTLTLNGAPDFSYTPALIVDNTENAVSNRLGAGTTVRSGGQGLNLTVKGNAAIPAVESIGTLDLGWGVHALAVNGSATATMGLSVSNLVQHPGAFAWGSFGTNGKLFFPHASAPHGVFPASMFIGENFATLDADASLKTATYAALKATANTTNLPAQISGTTVTLGENVEIPALRVVGGATVALGSHDLLLSTAGLIFNGYGNKSIASSGGKLIFGANDIVISQGSASTVISAPLAWNRPEGNTSPGPSILVPLYWSTLSFTGEDFIGDYNGVYTSGGNQTLVFDGPSNRTFHGPIVGSVTWSKMGSGTLRFNGPRLSYDQNQILHVREGRVIFANSTPWYKLTVYSNAVLEVADNRTVPIYPTLNPGFTLGGIGTLSFPDNNGTVNLPANSWLAPGSDGVIGTLTLRPRDWKNQTISSGSGIRIRLDETHCDRVTYTGWFYTTLPASGTINLDVSALSRDTLVAASQPYSFLTWTAPGSGYDPSNRDTFTWAITTSTPKTLDVSRASVSWNAASHAFVLTGVRNVQHGTVVLFL